MLVSTTVINTPEKIIKAFLNRVYRKEVRTGRPDIKTYAHNYDYLKQALDDGLGKDYASIDYNSPDWEYRQNLRYNTAVFAAFKQNKEITDAFKLLVDEEGRPRKWKEFYAEARKVSDKYNRRWLQTEYNQAHQSAVMARKWREFEETAHLYPNLKYKTVKDENVRLSHKKLDGVIFPIEHKFWDTYYPPNGWGCRCTVEQTDEEPDAEMPADLPEMPADMHNNVGKTAKVWTEEHPYYKTGMQHEVLEFVKTQIKPAQEVKDAYKKFMSFPEDYDKMGFNGNNGGFVVAEPGHFFTKSFGSKSEKILSNKLMNIGRQVIFKQEGKLTGIKDIDALVNGELWEFKGIETNSTRAVKGAITGAISKGAENMLIHFKDDISFDIIDGGIGRVEKLSLQNKVGAMPNIWYFNQNNELELLYKKSQP